MIYFSTAKIARAKIKAQVKGKVKLVCAGKGIHGKNSLLHRPQPETLKKLYSCRGALVNSFDNIFLYNLKC